jgi:hypothetical protein
MKLCMQESEGMLSHAAHRHLGEPPAVIVDYDVVTGDTFLLAADVDDEGACALEPIHRLSYTWLFHLDRPPLDPGAYRLRPNRDGSLTVDLTPCPT